jgi:hypothetical protein
MAIGCKSEAQNIESSFYNILLLLILLYRIANQTEAHNSLLIQETTEPNIMDIANSAVSLEHQEQHKKDDVPCTIASDDLPSHEISAIDDEDSGVSNQRLEVLNISNLYNNIKPGDYTHHHALLGYKSYFSRFNRRMKVYVMENASQMAYLFPCFVLKVAYDECVQYLLNSQLIESFQNSLINFVLPEKLNILTSTEVMSHLQTIFNYNLKIDKENWELLKAGFACYLHLLNARSDDSLINEVLSRLPSNTHIEESVVLEMVTEATELAWNMVTLVPPALVVQPTEYLEEWHDKRITSWDDDASPNPSIYFCPVLFHDSLGQIGCKGVIGNKLANDAIIIADIKKMSISEEKECAITIDNVESEFDHRVISSISWNKVPSNEDGYITIFPCSQCNTVNVGDVCGHCSNKKTSQDFDTPNITRSKRCRSCCQCVVL